ncbi:hypothetical protein PROFUN_11705 [Planoprotostelium fungivorum]|uniref:Uncharacterized protein n=1 Tax=Planoprotostelium fungivorum TaxID=1890364 RepID=A0A2P6N961_9EUKA|nr:hypothetical protein PROFUN_11705 [Planoprotostelium fungivorum]
MRTIDAFLSLTHSQFHLTGHRRVLLEGGTEPCDRSGAEKSHLCLNSHLKNILSNLNGYNLVRSGATRDLGSHQTMERHLEI